MSVTAEAFEAMTGRAPVNDDLHRVNCETPGALGHFMCGICPDHHWPRFMCGCLAELRTEAALQRIGELAPELMRWFGGKPILATRGRRSTANAVRLEDVEAWLRQRGVISSFDLVGSQLVPRAARLVDE